MYSYIYISKVDRYQVIIKAIEKLDINHSLGTHPNNSYRSRRRTPKGDCGDMRSIFIKEGPCIQQKAFSMIVSTEMKSFLYLNGPSLGLLRQTPLGYLLKWILPGSSPQTPLCRGMKFYVIS